MVTAQQILNEIGDEFELRGLQRALINLIELEVNGENYFLDLVNYTAFQNLPIVDGWGLIDLVMFRYFE